VRRLLAIAGLALASAAPAHAATDFHSTGTIRAPIPDGGVLERGLRVTQRGPVSFLRVSFRIEHPRTSDLVVSLVSPRGTEVPLAVRRGSGADFGEDEKGCDGVQAVFDSDERRNRLARADSPFISGPYAGEAPLARLYGEDARGRWAIRIRDQATGEAGRLDCFQLDLSRDVPQRLAAKRGDVSADVTFHERNFLYERDRLRVVRRGKPVVSSPLAKLRCPGCGSFRPVALRIRDLDGGEPEVLLELFSGGAHCCSLTLILGYDARHARYRSTLGYWGNYGSQIVDLDGDRRPEIAAFDERFVYEFAAYVFSEAPVQIWQYERGQLVDVTRRYPKATEDQAAELWASYLKARDEPDADVRGILAAWQADMALLGREEEGWRRLDEAYRRGDLGRTKQVLGWPAGRNYLATLRTFLRRTGYLS
jgi:subtilisin-like proprotein convertase family protein